MEGGYTRQAGRGLQYDLVYNNKGAISVLDHHQSKTNVHICIIKFIFATKLMDSTAGKQLRLLREERWQEKKQVTPTTAYIARKR